MRGLKAASLESRASEVQRRPTSRSGPIAKPRLDGPGDVLRQGAVVADRYRLEEMLWQGRTGMIWEATDLGTKEKPEERRVALKLFNDCDPLDTEAEARFFDEISSASGLSGPGFVEIVSYGMSARIPYVALELLDGEPLARHLRRMSRLSPLQSLWLFKELTATLAAAHARGVVHGAINPANLFLASQTGTSRPILKVLGFGCPTDIGLGSIAVEPDSEQPHYWSPEHVRTAAEVDQRADLWGAGAVLYRCMTGLRPFEGEIDQLMDQIERTEPAAPSSIVHGLGQHLDTFFRIALSKDPERRFATAESMFAAFEAAIAGIAPTPPAAPVASPAPTPAPIPLPGPATEALRAFAESSPEPEEAPATPQRDDASLRRALARRPFAERRVTARSGERRRLHSVSLRNAMVSGTRKAVSRKRRRVVASIACFAIGVIALALSILYAISRTRG
ncbi:MAG: serine/threonine protein kinase [Polyangiaceae bacterium]|nr:serine/threonine protein kinase [Polyangiaceae bacterium]